jgi:hypothetical protein
VIQRTKTMIMNTFIRPSLWFLCLLFNPFATNGQTSAPSESLKTGSSIFDILYHEQKAVNVTIKTQIKNLVANKLDEESVPAMIFFKDKAGKERKFEIKLEKRGKFRLRACYFPPLKLDFKKPDLRAAGLSDYDDMKMVTHCLEDPKKGKENVLREYLVYKLYNLLTPYSYRVQLIKIRYEDEDKTISKIKAYGFLIEDTKQMADRLNGDVLETFNLKTEEMLLENFQLQSLFQYLIGNADWDLGMQRNIKVLSSLSDEKLYVIPYDFDFSGLVNADYAIPNPDYGLFSVRDRVFLGASDELVPTTTYFLSKEKDMLKLCKKSKLLNRESRNDIVNYLYYCFREMENGPRDIRFPEDLLRAKTIKN